jgi:hypothetical protein
MSDNRHCREWLVFRRRRFRVLFTSTVPTNQAEPNDQDLPEDANDDDDDAQAAVDPPEDSTVRGEEADVVDTGAESLQRSQDALDQGRDAAREALKDRVPDEEGEGVDP